MPAGQLTERFRFYSISEVDGDLGSKRGDPVLQFEIWGKLQFLRGGEEVIAARLQSQQPAILTVRQTSRTKKITTDWQVEHVRTGARFNIREKKDPDMKRDWFEMLIQSGVAA